MAVIIDKAKEYGFILEVNPQFKLTRNNLMMCECKITFVDIKTNERIEDTQVVTTVCFKENAQPFFVLSYYSYDGTEIKEGNRVYDAVCKKVKETSITNIGEVMERRKQRQTDIEIEITEKEYKALKKKRGGK